MNVTLENISKNTVLVLGHSVQPGGTVQVSNVLLSNVAIRRMLNSGMLASKGKVASKAQPAPKAVEPVARPAVAAVVPEPVAPVASEPAVETEAVVESEPAPVAESETPKTDEFPRRSKKSKKS